MRFDPIAEGVREAIYGSKGGEKPRKAVEYPDSLHSIATARIIDLVSEGEIEGFAHGNGDDDFLQDVYYDETPIQNSDGTKNFKNFEVEARMGTADQTYIKGFPAVENALAIGVVLTATAAWERTFTNNQLSALRINIGVAGLSKTNPETGDIAGHTVRYAIDLSVDGGAYEEIMSSAFTGKSSGPYERSHRVDLPPAVTEWTVRVRRLTPNATSAYIQDVTQIISVTEIIDGKFRYPMSALVANQVDASQFQNIPTRAYHLKGRRIKVPTNYNPITRTYSGVWDGTFKIAYSNNPAWVFYDLSTHKRYGLGKLVSELVIDKWALYGISQFCDEMVPDGFGGTEPRMTCNVYLQKSGDAFRVMQDLASVFRGICYWAQGAIIAVADRETDPVYTYTNANVLNGAFRYEGTGRRARHTAVTVGYNDMTDFGRMKTDYYDDKEGIARFGFQPIEITAFGCTSRGQARRVARWLLLSEKLLTNTVAFSVGIDGTFAVPGQIIRVADKYRAGRRIGGRIVSMNAAKTQVTIDRLPTPLPVIGDTLTVTLATGISETRTVSAVDGPGRKLTVSVAYSNAAVSEAVWAIESTDLKTQLFRVMAVTEGEGGTHSIFALQHNASLFDAVDFDEPINDPPISDIAAPNQVAPTSVTISANERAGQVVAMPQITATWPETAGAVHYLVQWRREYGEWTNPQKVIGKAAEYNAPFPGIYECKVSAVNAIGVTSVPRYSDEFTLTDQSLTPGFVAELNADIAAALLEAQNAAAIADGAVVSFWQITAPAIGSGAGQAKEGDIWFDTDDGNTIWRVVGGTWVNAQDDELALALAAATTAQATADGKVKTFFAATAPTAESVGDLWFNTTTKKLFRWNGSNWNSEIADVTLDQLGGSGVNVMPAEYSLFEHGGVPTTVRNPASVPALPDLDGTALALNKPMMKWTSTGADGYVYLDDSTIQYNIPVTPGKKWLVSFYMKSSVAAPNINVYMKRNNDAGHTLVNVTGPAVAGTIERVSGVVDLSASPSTTAVVMRLDLDVAGDIWVGGIMVEELIGRKTDPSAYSRGTYARLWADTLSVAEAALDTADGKIETYFQTSMPAGASLGDLWFDTDDGNKIYRHNGTTFVEIQDDAIAQAILAAAGAQATADGKITTYYAATAPGGTKAVGDLWYDTTGKDLSRWNGSAWIEVSDITEDKIGGNGTNIMWEEYSLFTRAQTLTKDTVPPFGDHLNISSIQTVADAGAVGGFSLQTALTAAVGHVRLASSSTDNNMRIGSNKKYLISYWARASGGGAAIQPWVRGALAVDAPIQNITTVRTRYTWVLDASAIADGEVHFGYFTNKQAVPTAHTVWVDGWMIEPMSGNVTTPSPYTPGPSARQTLRQMIQQNITDGGRNLVSNPGLVWNLIGAPTSGWLVEESVCDGWKCGLAHGSLLLQRTASDWKTGAWELVVTWGNNPAALANGQTARAILMVRKSWAVIPGEKFIASVRAKSDFNTSLPAGVTGIAYLRCAFYDAAMTFISYGFTTITRAGGWAKYNTDPMTVPTNAAFMDVRLDFNIINSSGVSQTPAAGQFPWILQVTDFEVFKVTNLDDDVEDGVVHGRIANQDTFAVSLVRRLGLRVGNSGHRLGNQRNIPRSNTSAYGMVRTTTALSATSAGAVSVNAHTVRYGGYSVAYTAVANAVTGLTVGSTYVIYCSDPNLDGGVRTYLATTSPDAAMNISDDIYAVGQITIPSSGSSSGGGGSSGGNPNDWCVDADMILPDGRRAGDIQKSEVIPCWDENAERPGIVHLLVESNQVVEDQPCHMIITSSGAKVIASDSTPMTLRDGRTIRLPEMLGEQALVRFASGELEWERVIFCEPVAPRAVAKIKVHQKCYFAGVVAGATIATHNPTYKP